MNFSKWSKSQMVNMLVSLGAERKKMEELTKPKLLEILKDHRDAVEARLEIDALIGIAHKMTTNN